MTDAPPSQRGHAALDLPPVMSPGEVRALQEGGRHVVLADVRWYLDGRDGRAAYDAEHLEGAVFVDLEEHLTRHDLPSTEGRHPLPDPADFAASLTALGIGDGTPVIAYDDTGGMTAGRLVVMLRMLGHPAALLDGGLAAGVAARVRTSPPDAPAVGASPRPWPVDRLAGPQDVVRGPDDRGVSLDARPLERFTGEVTAIDPRPGHIPGGTSAPWSAVLDPGTGTFRSPSELAEHYASLGVTATGDGDDVPDVVVSCGSGVSACMNALAMERAGLAPPRLYVASFSGWSADPDHPVEQGPGRGR